MWEARGEGAGHADTARAGQGDTPRDAGSLTGRLKTRPSPQKAKCAARVGAWGPDLCDGAFAQTLDST